MNKLNYNSQGVKVVNALESIVDASNLAVDVADTRQLRPAASPTLVFGGSGRIIARLTHEQGQSLLMAEGLILKYIDPGEAVGHTLGPLDSAPRCVVQGTDSVVIMTDNKDWTLYRDKVNHRWRLLGARPEMPPVSLLVTQKSTISTVIPSGELTGNYPLGGPLSYADRDALTATLLASYKELHTKTASMGLAIQPVLAYYRVVGDDGRTLYQSSPVMLSADGFNCVDTETAVVEGSKRVASMLSAEAWRMGVRVNGTITGDWASRAARLEVYATPQIIPLDLRCSASGRMSTGGVLSFTMPGVVEEAAGEAQRQVLVREVLERPAMMRLVKVIPYPFAGSLSTDTTLEVPLPLTPDAQSEWSRQLAAINAKAVTSESLPAEFIADTATRCGDTIAYGNPQVPWPMPAGLLTVAQTTGDSSWRGAVSVKVGSAGKKVVWSGSFTDHAPLSISPLLCYPSAQATEMEIMIEGSDGQCFSERLPLTASTVSDVAYYMRQDLRPWSPSTPATWSLPETTASRRSYPGAIIAALADSPLTPTGMATTSGGALSAITPASRSASAWNFGRSHFYAFSSEGIFSVAVANGGVLNGADIIDRRGVDSASKVALGADAVWALAGDAVVKVSGNRTTTVMRHPEAGAIGWSGAGCAELWLRDSDGKTRAIDQSSGFASRRGDAQWLWGDGSQLYLRDSRGVKVVDNGFYTPSTATSPIEVTGTAKSGGAREAAVILPITGANVDLTVEIMAHDHPWRSCSTALDDVPVRVGRTSISGTMRRPAVLRVKCPARQYLTVKIMGTVSGDTVIER